MSPRSRNPNWTRDELILTLDTYFKADVEKLTKNDDIVLQLSKLLQSLNAYESKYRTNTYRNPDGVLMKLLNIHSIECPGKGLSNASKLDKQIFNEFVNNKQQLEMIASKIINAISTGKQFNITYEDEGFMEGAILEKYHKYKERNSTAVKSKKNKMLNEQGFLQCEICGFIFEDSYGELGNGYIECHHIVPLADIDVQKKTQMSDLALVCSNCHRMLHRKRPWITISELKKIVEEHKHI